MNIRREIINTFRNDGNVLIKAEYSTRIMWRYIQLRKIEFVWPIPGDLKSLVNARLLTLIVLCIAYLECCVVGVLLALLCLTGSQHKQFK